MRGLCSSPRAQWRSVSPMYSPLERFRTVTANSARIILYSAFWYQLLATSSGVKSLMCFVFLTTTCSLKQALLRFFILFLMLGGGGARSSKIFEIRDFLASADELLSALTRLGLVDVWRIMIARNE